MKTDEIKERISELEAHALFADGFEDALIGHTEGMANGSNIVAVYDIDKCIAILKTRDGMDDETAEEFLSYNTLGSYVGSYTPIFVRILR